MPTENRSSNTEMVSVLLPCPFCGQQDFLIDRLDSDASVVICQGLTGPHEACLARGPVGVAQNEGEEQPGRDYAVELWNARAAQLKDGPVVAQCPLCSQTHEQVLIGRVGGQQPDICDVDFTTWRCGGCGGSWSGDTDDDGEVGRLRAELAELWRATNLLMKVTPRNKGSWADKFEAIAIIERLCAGAEPSAPKCDHQLKCARFENGEIVDYVCQNCRQVLPRVEPDAPVEIDERAEFEQACREAAIARGRELDPEALRRRTDGSHVNPLTECGWWGWQARAALNHKPS